MKEINIYKNNNIKKIKKDYKKNKYKRQQNAKKNKRL